MDYDDYEPYEDDLQEWGDREAFEDAQADFAEMGQDPFCEWCGRVTCHIGEHEHERVLGLVTYEEDSFVKVTTLGWAVKANEELSHKLSEALYGLYLVEGEVAKTAGV